jgi:polar amino acid transport system permease protein
MGGLLLTVIMGALGIIGGTLLGVAIGLMRASANRWLTIPSVIYVQVLRNIPLLILIFWLYFIPPHFGVETSKFLSVSLALVIFNAAYIAEIVRSGIRSVPPGTIEAAKALGLTSWHVRLWIVLPQALFATIPALTGRYITTVKNTSLAYLIGFSEVTEIGREINARLMVFPIEVYATVMIMYFCVNRCVSAFMRLLEDRDRFHRLFLRL